MRLQKTHALEILNVYLINEQDTILDSVTPQLSSIGYMPTSFKTIGDFLLNIDDIDTGLLVLNIPLSNQTNLKIARQFIRQVKPMPVIVISDDANISTVVQLMKAGAKDFMELTDNVEHLLNKFRDRFHEYMRVVAMPIQAEDRYRRFMKLTNRQQQVVTLLINGYSNREIAEKLFLSQRTVETHRAKAMETMQTNSLAILVRMVDKFTHSQH